MKPTQSKSAKSSVNRRSINASATQPAPFQEQDPKRRLGSYTGAGEHARQQGRGYGKREASGR